MSVLIKGMEMPKKKNGAVLIIYPDGRCAFENSEEYKAVPVPPHGRLIDADALMHEFEKAQRTMAQHGQEYSCSFMSSSQEISTEWYCVEDMVENAPTIVPADKKDYEVYGELRTFCNDCWLDWLKQEVDEDDACPFCGCYIPTDDGHDAIFKNEVHFCYYCGARMGGGNGDD